MPIHPFRSIRSGAQAGPRSLIVLAILGSACARPATIPAITLPFPADSNVARLVAPGVVQRSIWSSKGPWGIQVLDVDLSRCYSAVALKGAPGATGRKKVSALLEELRPARDVIGGVNADFFSLSGFQGVPSGALISEGRVIVGPGPQPALVFDSTGRVRIMVLRGDGRIGHKSGSTTVPAWNRPFPKDVSIYDGRWGAALDSATGVVEVTIDNRRVTRIDTSVAGSAIPKDGYVIVTGRNAPEEARKWLRSWAVGDSVDISLSLSTLHPLEAVGGRPMLARDSAVADEVETEGQASFRARNPRTAAGIANDGKRLILAVIDGRQKPWSDGMTLRETAELMLALGARDAINLDGGGSSALVYLDPATKSLRVASKPSDAMGERAVGDALGIVKGCSR